MERPLEITFRNMDASTAVEEVVRKKVEGLQKFCGDVTGCRVTIESPHHHQRKGRAFHIRIELSMPGRDIVVARDPGDISALEDPYVAVRDAFRAAKRQLQDYADVRHHRVKRHRERSAPPSA